MTDLSHDCGVQGDRPQSATGGDHINCVLSPIQNNSLRILEVPGRISRDAQNLRECDRSHDQKVCNLEALSTNRCRSKV